MDTAMLSRSTPLKRSNTVKSKTKQPRGFLPFAAQQLLAAAMHLHAVPVCVSSIWYLCQMPDASASTGLVTGI
jgi:hypothetical protein